MLVQEQVVLTSQDPVLNWMTNQLGIQLREVEDELIRDMLLSSAGQINSVGGVNGDNPTEITATDIAGASATLFNANAYTIANVVEGQNKFGKLCAEVKSFLIDLEAVA